MNDFSLHPLARDYLKRLNKAAANLPRARRKELIREIESHLSEALPAGASEAEALNVLERLGEPADIVAEAGTGQAPARAGLNEWLAIPLLLIGGVVIPVLGWFVGVVLLWTSRIWTVRDKLIGTLVVPGGLATAVFLVLGVGGERERRSVFELCDHDGWPTWRTVRRHGHRLRQLRRPQLFRHRATGLARRASCPHVDLPGSARYPYGGRNMNDSSLHPLSRDYLMRLQKAARRLPRTRRKELVEEVEAHLREALPVNLSEAETREVLKRLGEPEQIAAEASTRDLMPERIAVFLLLSSGVILPGLGWIAGLVLLWRSRTWSQRDKLIGTIVPGTVYVTVLTVWLVDGSERVRDLLGNGPILAILIALPVLTAVYLWRSASRVAAADA